MCDINEIYIKVTKNGPYMIYGAPPVVRKKILSDENGVCIDFSEGENFEIKSNPIALCRCGCTKTPPFCDNSHHENNFDGTESASFEPILNNAVKYVGKNLILYDNENYCALARFCDANGSIWNLIYEGSEEADNEVKRQAALCPSGRLIIFDKNGNVIEPRLDKMISVLEDNGLKISGPIYVQGGIKVVSENGESYEIRNRQTLCRCGKSKNKPFCDCTHKHVKFKAKNND